MKPYVLKQVVNEHHEILFEGQQQVVRRVISTTTAETLTRFFVGVVQRGTGVSAQIPTISIAGKTGTSRKFVGGKYEMGSYTASFVGYFPVENPRAVCLVMLDNPRAGGYTGGYASAPIFRDITEKVVTTSGRFTEHTTTVAAQPWAHVVPDVTNLHPEVAAAMLSSQGFEVETRGNGKVVLRQSPAPGERNAPPGRVRLITEDAQAVAPPGYTVVPSLKGLGIRRAINRLTTQQLDAVVEGSGIVVAQSSQPGQQVKIGSRVALRCEPRSLATVALY
jgi:membrane peptidoglycan carboxypeptidase